MTGVEEEKKTKGWMEDMAERMERLEMKVKELEEEEVEEQEAEEEEKEDRKLITFKGFFN